MVRLDLPNKKYQIIYADPPWRFGSKELYGDKKSGQVKRENRFREIERFYETMSIENLKRLPIKQITDKDCALFLWCTDAHLKEGIEVIEAWGFKYKTVAFNWIKKYNTGKTCVNFAPWTLKSHELCLLGIKGKMGEYKQSNSIRGLIEAERSKHSKKPEEARRRIELLFGDLPRIELFARNKVDGWDAWGDELPEEDVTLEDYASGD